MIKLAGDIITLHICTKNHNHMRYGSWDMECDRQNFLSLWTVFCPFTPPMDQENQHFEKMKKTLEDIIILQMFTINNSHLIYGFSDRECNRQNILSFWTVFCPFTPLTIQKIKILKNWKKNPGYAIILYKCTRNLDHMLYCSLDMAHNGLIVTFHFGLFF